MLLERLYRGSRITREVYLPYRRAALSFMRWQLHRKLLNPLDHERPGSPWWRAVNERFLRDTCEARACAVGRNGPHSSEGVRASLLFIREPTASNWYRAHNVSIVSAYLDLRELAAQENRVERFFINLVLLRVLFAHALVAAPKLALGWLSPLAPRLGDPRLGMASMFLSLSRVLPDHYPLVGELASYVKAENGFGHLLDVGVIAPRIRQLYEWSAAELALPELADLLHDGVPSYVWDPRDKAPWNPAPSPLSRLARRVLRAEESVG
jgi:hypothetical protein